MTDSQYIAQLESILIELMDEARNSVEYSDWPELQEIIERAEKIVYEERNEV